MAMDLLESCALELGIRLDSAMLKSFARFSCELDRWNQKINLTSIKGVDNVSLKHFLDSLTVPAMVDVKGKLLDIGSGAGFPGIPIKIVRPELHVCSVDSVEKKIIFQRHLARLIGLQGFTAVHARGESLSKNYGGHFDFVVSRAFSDIIKFVKIGTPLLGEGGLLIAMKGGDGKKECDTVKNELAEIGISITGIIEFKLPITGDSRTLITMSAR